MPKSEISMFLCLAKAKVLCRYLTNTIRKKKKKEMQQTNLLNRYYAPT